MHKVKVSLWLIRASSPPQVQQLRGHFAPYVEDVAEIVLNLLTFALDEEVRSLAVSVVRRLDSNRTEISYHIAHHIIEQLWDRL